VEGEGWVEHNMKFSHSHLKKDKSSISGFKSSLESDDEIVLCDYSGHPKLPDDDKTNYDTPIDLAAHDLSSKHSTETRLSFARALFEPPKLSRTSFTETYFFKLSITCLL